MKTSMVLVLSVLSTCLFTSGCINNPVPAAPSESADFDYVVNLEGFKKEAIYEGVQQWIAENFRSAKHVIEYENKEQGVIIGNGVLSGIILDSGMVQLPETASFTMKVEVRDNKMRLSFSKLQIVGRVNSTFFTFETVEIKRQLMQFGDEIAGYLKKSKDKNF